MVEIRLEPTDGGDFMPNDCYLSVRVGNVQKFSRLAAQRSYQFPNSLGNKPRYGRIEVFHRIGHKNLEFEASDGATKICIDCEGGGQGGQSGVLGLNLGVTDSDPQAAVVDQLNATPKSSAKVTAAKEYLAKHNLEQRLSDAMQAVLRERPEDPTELIMKKLTSSLPSPGSSPKARAQAGRVSMSMTFANMNFDLLMKNAPVRRGFEKAIKSDIASRMKRKPSDVALRLASGSVNVFATVAGTDGFGAAEKLKGLGKKVAASVTAVPGIAAVCNGTISVDDPFVGTEPDLAAACGGMGAEERAQLAVMVNATAGGNGTSKFDGSAAALLAGMVRERLQQPTPPAPKGPAPVSALVPFGPYYATNVTPDSKAETFAKLYAKFPAKERPAISVSNAAPPPAPSAPKVNKPETTQCAPEAAKCSAPAPIEPAKQAELQPFGGYFSVNFRTCGPTSLAKLYSKFPAKERPAAAPVAAVAPVSNLQPFGAYYSANFSRSNQSLVGVLAKFPAKAAQAAGKAAASASKATAVPVQRGPPFALQPSVGTWLAKPSPGQAAAPASKATAAPVQRGPPFALRPSVGTWLAKPKPGAAQPAGASAAGGSVVRCGASAPLEGKAEGSPPRSAFQPSVGTWLMTSPKGGAALPKGCDKVSTTAAVAPSGGAWMQHPSVGTWLQHRAPRNKDLISWEDEGTLTSVLKSFHLPISPCELKAKLVALGLIQD